MKKEVQILLGDPKKAIIKMALPMMIGMFVHALYNLADGFWVAGLGADELAAVGLFFPFFMLILAIGGGIGIGGSSAISRRIGEKNKREADNTAVHTLIIGVGIAFILGIGVLPFLDRIFIFISGSQSVGKMTADYARILFGGSTIMIFSHLVNAILRGEGDAKRAMYVMMAGSFLNIILDPVFIFWLDMGVAGAAWATIISISLSSSILFYWLFFKKDTYLDITFKKFKFDKKIIQEILSVGIPSSLAQISMSISMIFLNSVILIAGGTNGIAVFTSGWRIIMMGTIPLLGLASGVTTVTAATFGAKEHEKLKTAFFYSIKFGLLIEGIIGLIVFLFADQFASLFTYSEGAKPILNDLRLFLRINSLIFPIVPFGMLTSAMFRGIKRGNASLMVTIIRTILLQIPLAYLFGVILDMGLLGVWIGIILGNMVAVIITFFWGKHAIENVKFSETVI